ncbi:MAG: hypothetical protein WCP89_01750 [archaeon]
MKKRNRWKSYLLAILIVVIILLLSFNTSIIFRWIGGKSPINNSEECVKIQTSCCPCNNGGDEKCVLKSEVEKYNESLKNCPGRGELICATFFNCKIESCKYDSAKKECTEVLAA